MAGVLVLYLGRRIRELLPLRVLKRKITAARVVAALFRVLCGHRKSFLNFLLENSHAVVT